MMNYHKLAIMLLLSSFSTLVSATEYKTVTLSEAGMVSSYWKVPSNFKCHINIPDVPTAFCKSPGGVTYHMGSLGTFQYVLNPDQYIYNIEQKVASQPNARIVKKYTIPRITQHLVQQDARMLYRQGQRVFTYAFDTENTDKNEVGVSVIVVYVVPNNGTPISFVDFYAVSIPSTRENKYNKIRDQLLLFVLSRRYNEKYLQAINSQHIQFQANLSARKRAFNNRQTQIHKNNMDAMDSRYNAYRKRSAASDKAQGQFVDSIHERQQMVDPDTGARYQVEGYSDYNYVNPNDSGASIQTNNPLYDPNINTNQGEYYNQLE